MTTPSTCSEFERVQRARRAAHSHFEAEKVLSMSRRILVLTSCFAALIGSAAAQTQTGPRTPNGQPDIQGIWSFATLTPFERPAELAAKEFFTEQEAAEYERTVIERNNMDRRDGGAARDVERAYNDFWWDRGTNVVKTRRTSLIVDPPDGKIPPLTPEGQKRQAERAARNKGHEFDGPENRPLGERCVIWASTGPPTLPTAYNNNLQIVQTPGYVMVLI